MAAILDLINIHRDKIEKEGSEVIKLTKNDFFKQGEADEQHDRGEMIANIKLAYRHLEDARMRLGKVIQAYKGGVSIYDQEVPSYDESTKNPVDFSRNDGETSV